MNFSARNFSASLTLLALLVAAPAQAQEGAPQNQNRVEIDTNLFCDTQQQVERFASLFNGDQVSAEAALAEVNAEHKLHDACVIATAAYQRAGPVSTVRNGGATFDVVRIVVVGIYTINGLEQSLPTEFFTLIPQDESSTVGQR
jgi:Zn-dependent alcohol dehydrogenase